MSFGDVRVFSKSLNILKIECGVIERVEYSK